MDLKLVFIFSVTPDDLLSATYYLVGINNRLARIANG